MPSKESQVLYDLFSSMRKRSAENPNMGIEGQRAQLELLHEPASEPTEVVYEEVQCPGSNRPAIWCKPVSSQSKSAILYLHGGGGIGGSPYSHRKLAGHLAKAARCPVLVTDYSLAPEHPFPSGLEDGAKTFKWLVNDKGYKAQNIGLAGDSAGGNLVTSLGLKLRDEGGPQPAAIAAFSPWVDMECTGESLVTNAATEALTPSENIPIIAGMYLGGASPKDPLANALYADFAKGFPPFNITVGGAEALLSDATRLADKAKAAGVDITFEIYPGMQHVFQFMAGRAPESIKSINDVGAWFVKKLNH